MATINNLTIEFGYKCNSHCTYCYQNPHKGEKFEQNIDKVVSFLLFLQKKEVLADNFSLMLYGGESTLYLNQIEELRKKIKENGLNIPIFITTNGILLKEEGDRIIGLNLHPTISIDGGPNIQRICRGDIPKNYYPVIADFIEKAHKKDIVVTCQSTITPLTVSNLFETFLLATSLKFDKWWFELECLSEIGKNQWNEVMYRQYKKQIQQIKLCERCSNMEIIPFKIVRKVLDNDLDQDIRLLIDPKGGIHFSCFGITNLTESTFKDFYLGTLNSPIPDIIERIQKLSLFSYHPVYKSSLCEKCELKEFCLNNLEYPYNELYQIQDGSNCGRWRYLLEGMKDE